MTTISIQPPTDVDERRGARPVLAKTAAVAVIAMTVLSILTGLGLYVWSLAMLATSSGAG